MAPRHREITARLTRRSPIGTLLGIVFSIALASGHARGADRDHAYASAQESAAPSPAPSNTSSGAPASSESERSATATQLAPVTVPAPATEPATTGSRQRIAGLAIIGLGLIATIVGVVFLVDFINYDNAAQAPNSAWSQYLPPIMSYDQTSLCDAAEHPSTPAVAQYNASHPGLASAVATTCNQASVLSTGEVVAFVSGAVLIAAGVFVYFTAHSPPRAAHSAQRRWMIAPSIATTGAGMVFALRF